jgi:hypothetical protein
MKEVVVCTRLRRANRAAQRSIAYQHAFPPDAEIEILLGTSLNMANWRFYNFA